MCNAIYFPKAFDGISLVGTGSIDMVSVISSNLVLQINLILPVNFISKREWE